jgi:hypothetical protein
MIDLAYMRLGELSGRIASADRAAILRQPGVRLRAAPCLSLGDGRTGGGPCGVECRAVE